MSFRTTMRNKWTWIIGVPVLLVIVFVGGPFVYINFIKDDARHRSSWSRSTRTRTTAPPRRPRRRPRSIAGTWEVKSGSQVGYRAKEVLFGQSTEAAGRTTGVTGTMSINGTTVEDATFTADLTGLKSDSGQPRRPGAGPDPEHQPVPERHVQADEADRARDRAREPEGDHGPGDRRPDHPRRRRSR